MARTSIYLTRHYILQDARFEKVNIDISKKLFQKYASTRANCFVAIKAYN
jgi:hypothetical protein